MAHRRVSNTRVLVDGFGMGESPRWHEGRLWFSSWGTAEIVAGCGAARRLALKAFAMSSYPP